jgi:cytochrome c oxidase subunit 4
MSTDHADHKHDGHDHGHDDHGDDGAVHVHISSTRFYVGIFLGLCVLTVLTVKVSYYDFGPANIIVAMLIATMKAGLVATFFMHLAHDKLFNTLSFLSAFVFLGVFIMLTYDDLGNRAQLDWGYGGTVDPHTGIAAPGGMPATSATIDDVEGEPPSGGPQKAGPKEPKGEAPKEEARPGQKPSEQKEEKK